MKDVDEAPPLTKEYIYNTLIGKMEYKFEIKKNILLSEVIKSYGIDLTGGPDQWTAPCPFHQDGNPSLSISDKLGSFNCFGCKEHGDVFDYIRKMEGCDFETSYKKALKFVNNSTVVSSNTTPNVSTDEMNKVGSIVERTISYFQSQLTPDIATRYLMNGPSFKYPICGGVESFSPYGFDWDIVNKYRIGFAPSSMKDFVKTLVAEGFTKKEIALSGLFLLDKNDNLRAHYRNRIVFPYLDEHGNVLYSIGRRTELTPANKYEGKYLKQLTHTVKKPYVSPCVKNDHIFMAHLAETSDCFVITEGITDCIAANSKGIPCISPVTVQFSHKDREALASLCKDKSVLICNDVEENESGLKGAISTEKLLIKNGVDAHIVRLLKPSGVEKIDLCEYLKLHSRFDFNKLLPIDVNF